MAICNGTGWTGRAAGHCNAQTLETQDAKGPGFSMSFMSFQKIVRVKVQVLHRFSRSLAETHIFLSENRVLPDPVHHSPCNSRFQGSLNFPCQSDAGIPWYTPSSNLKYHISCWLLPQVFHCMAECMYPQ